jgi:hypothetical protein
MTIISDYVPPNDDPASGPEGGWRFHAAGDPAPTPWLIKGILPETGAGLSPDSGGPTRRRRHSTSRLAL